ncbi:MAG: glycyl radical enzyme domain-containing protein [Dermatophilaceae bacterium]
MFGIFGLAECVAELLAHDGVHDARYGHDDGRQRRGIPDRRAGRRTRRGATTALLRGRRRGGLPALPGRHRPRRRASPPAPASRSATSRRCASTSPCALRITDTSPSGISDIFHVDETAVGNPQAMVDIIRGAFAVGMRDFTFNLDDNEFIRITGYLVRKSDLVDIDDRTALGTAATTSPPAPSATSISPSVPSSGSVASSIRPGHPL